MSSALFPQRLSRSPSLFSVPFKLQVTPSSPQFRGLSSTRNVRSLSRGQVGAHQLARPHQICPRKTKECLRSLSTTPPSQPGTTDIELKLGGAQTLRFSPIALRDACSCPRCVDPSNKQKLFQTCDIPPTIHGIPQLRGSYVDIKWSNDILGYPEDHTTTLPADFLLGRSRAKLPNFVPWGAEVIAQKNVWLDYGDWMKDDEALHRGLEYLHTYGLLFIRNVPESEQSVEHIAGRVGVLRDTFYGRTWDVKSKPEAKNIAYTHQFLGFHMDLLYMKDPPHLQLLHSLRARTPGGESLFSDAFRAYQQLSPEHQEAFATIPVTYHYDNDNQFYECSRPSIEGPGTAKDHTVQIQPVDSRHKQRLHFNWSPPFQAPFPLGQINAVGRYHQAARAFNEIITRPESIFEYRLQEGECVIFDNRRTLHARRAFDATKGERWLKGAYVDADVYYSKYLVLRDQYVKDTESGRHEAYDA